MRKLPYVIFLFLLLTNLSHAQGKILLAIGPTISYFPSAENTRPKVGISIGIVKDFHLYDKFLLSSGIGFASRGAILENRTIAPYASQPTDAYYQDIHGMLCYIEIPANIQYEIPYSKEIKFKPFIGPIFTFPILDLTHFKKNKFYKNYIPHQSDKSLYDHDFEQESVFNNNVTKVGFNFGFQIRYQNYGLEFRYVLDGRKVYHFDSLSEVSYKMHSMYVLISF